MKKLSFAKLKKRIEKSGLFDKSYYLKQYQDVRLASETPIEHYCKIGIKEDRKPNASFDPAWYREYYQDVKEDSGYPFMHYIIFGEAENRFRNEAEKNKFKNNTESFFKIFNEESYLAANLDIKTAVSKGEFKSALEHFEKSGCNEIREGKRRLGAEFPLFSEEDYLAVNPDLQAALESGTISSAFDHFLEHGFSEFLSGSRMLGGYYSFEFTDEMRALLKNRFDEEAYLEANPDVKAAVEGGAFESGFAHFVEHGISEVQQGKRSIHSSLPPIDEAKYLFDNRDIFEALKSRAIRSPYEHFLIYGAWELVNGTRKLPGSAEYAYKESLLTEEIEKEIENFTAVPLISIVMPVYNVDPKWLDLAIKSIEAQWYENWELCIADDKSTKKETIEYLKSINDPKIKITFLENNMNISGASNAALKLAKGEYVALMDNDDELTPDAFYEVVKAINETGAEFIYSDEDKLELDGRYIEPHFKPDFAPDMFLSQNYLSHLGVVKKSLIDKVGGWEIGLEGAQDYDLYLKVLEQTEKIVHIPKVLYHWRKIPGSTAAEFSDKSYAQEAGVKALENAMKRRNIAAKVENGTYPGTYRVKHDISGEPLVSIIIPFKDKPELLDMCINSILDKTTYRNYEIIGISNNSEEAATFDMMNKLEKKDQRVSFYEYNVPFNYSQINNHAVRNFSKGKHIILLNNDIEIITPSWIEEMLQYSQREDVGVVGAKLYYPNDTIQHAGVILGIGGVAGHSHKYFSKESTGYFSRLNIIQNLSAVTAACLMVKRSVYDKVNGLNEDDLKIAFNDVDFCLRILEDGCLNVYTPYCEAYHHESISRGAEDNPEKIARFNSEVAYMQLRHKEILENGDRFYNRNLTLDHENFGLK